MNDKEKKEALIILISVINSVILLFSCFILAIIYTHYVKLLQWGICYPSIILFIVIQIKIILVASHKYYNNKQ